MPWNTKASSFLSHICGVGGQSGFWIETMRLFKGRQKKVVRPQPPKPVDDSSIGSQLSIKDQFDIVLPPRRKKETGWSFFEHEDQSEVSSITTDEYRRGGYYSNGGTYYSHRQSDSSSWCCCSHATADTTVETTDNTLVASSRGDKDPAKNNNDDIWECCAANDPVLRKQRISKGLEEQGYRGALFDSLSASDEDDHDYREQVETKRRAWRLRRGLPWKRRLSQAT